MCVLRAALVTTLPLLALGCPRPKRGANTVDGASSAAAVSSASYAASAFASAAPPLPPPEAPSPPTPQWITLNDEGMTDVPVRVSGLVLHPEIELPARTVSTASPDTPWTARAGILANFPYIRLRTRGLPAVSADGARVAHVFGAISCCRGTGYNEFALFVFDARTGARKSKLLLWTIEDEHRIPQDDPTEGTGTRVSQGVRADPTEAAHEHNLLAYEKLLAARLAAAQAALDGEWTTLGNLALDEDDDGKRRLRGEGLDISLAAKAAFPPVAIAQSGAIHTFPGSRFRVVSGRTCPAESQWLRLDGGYGLRERPFAIVETSQGYAAPDGCEGGNAQFVVWTK
jgi:hypothetical protein